MSPHLLLSALVLLGLAPLAAAQRGRQDGTSNSVAVRNERPTRFVTVTDPGLFGSGTSLAGFLQNAEGSEVTGPLGLYGAHLSLDLSGNLAPLAWIDRTPRPFPPTGGSAITNNRPGRPILEEDGCVLRVTFDVPVNRAGFQLRRLDGDELNLIVRCFHEDVEVGTRVFDADEHFQFIAVQSSELFDELRVEFTNPADALFSLDNLVAELDLRDSDRDGTPDFIDPCPLDASGSLRDRDGDGLGDGCDTYPLDADNDADQDGVGAPDDNCPGVYNPDQLDTDLDGDGDGCDATPFGGDTDQDGVYDALDNCRFTFNPEQADCDSDGLGDVCDDELIHPSSVSYELQAGDCVTLTKTVCLPPAPPRVDVLLVVDTTGSMTREMANLRRGVVAYINGVRQALPLSDIRFGLVSFRDYPNIYSTCGYEARYAAPFDPPVKVEAPIGATNAEVLEAVLRLEARGGGDKHEAYTRVLWEVTQPDSGFGFRPNSARFVVLIGDAGPHDCDVGLYLAGTGCVPHFSTGLDPGRDGIAGTPDDLDFHADALLGLMNNKVRLLGVYTGSNYFCSWQTWTGLTRGFAVQGTPEGDFPQGTAFINQLVNLIRRSTVREVAYSAENPCDLGLTFDPPSILGPIDVTHGAQVSFQETICVPPSLAAGGYDCGVNILMDDILVGTQRVHLDVGCRNYRLDFETEDDFTTALINAQSVASPTYWGRMVRVTGRGANLGPAIFDSTPGGPNDPSLNSDMLVGRGNLLLLQDSGRPRQSVPGFFDQVTDDPDGGDLVFDFVVPVHARSIQLVDINPPPNRGASVTLFDINGLSRVYSVEPGWTGTYGVAGPWELDLTTLEPQRGNGTPRWARAVQDPGFLGTSVTQIVVHMTGFGAVDELRFCR